MYKRQAHLAALGGLRSGAGLVTVAAPAGLETALRVALPEALVRPLAETAAGTLAAPEARDVDALLAEYSSVKGVSALLDQAVAALTKSIGEVEQLEVRSRGIVEQMAVCLQAAVLIQAGNGVVADAFCHGRLGGGTGRMFGAGVVEHAMALVESTFLE